MCEIFLCELVFLKKKKSLVWVDNLAGYDAYIWKCDVRLWIMKELHVSVKIFVYLCKMWYYSRTWIKFNVTHEWVGTYHRYLTPEYIMLKIPELQFGNFGSGLTDKWDSLVLCWFCSCQVKSFMECLGLFGLKLGNDQMLGVYAFKKNEKKNKYEWHCTCDFSLRSLFDSS